MKYICAMHFHVFFLTNKITDALVIYDPFVPSLPVRSNSSKGAASFHIHRKTIKDLWALAVLCVRELPNLAQNLVIHSQ